ncbi:MAG TPA: ferritin-like domain-containing protein [Burkholderiaceae bacterium]|nr:ferritin-like domain-containing protein [Burkholderiaceae bacterium]
MQSPTVLRAGAGGAGRANRPDSSFADGPRQGRTSSRPVWRVGEIDFARVDRRHRPDTTLFYLLAAASFIECGSELYTRNLLTYYRDDPQIADWLSNVWEQEEMQHGAALRAYVQVVWPEFDWNEAYRRFIGEYSQAASPDAFEATPQLELAARCMIETGTTSLYRMLHEYAQEPVLRRVLAHIRDDEVNHYKHFLQYFRAGQRAQGPRRLKVAWAIGRRVRESRSDDAWIAFRHAFEVTNPGRTCGRSDFGQWQTQWQAIVRRTFPFRTAADMLVAPLALPVLLRRLARRAAELALRRVLLA